MIASERCLGCHRPARTVAGLAASFHSKGRGDCTSCHSFHHPEELKAGDARFVHAFGDDQVGRQCATCHAPGKRLDLLSEGHRSATVLYHGGAKRLAELSPSEACLQCHSKHDADVTVLAAAADLPRFAEHASHSFGSRVSPGRSTGGFRIRRSIDARIPLFDGVMECQSCHDIASKGEDLLVRFESKYDLCLGCHQRQGEQEAVVVAAAPERDETAEIRSFGLSD